MLFHLVRTIFVAFEPTLEGAITRIDGILKNYNFSVKVLLRTNNPNFFIVLF